MKILMPLLFLINISIAWSQDKNNLISSYFDRPLNCPLRFSNLAQLRDQVQALTSVLSNGCTQNGQQALNQLNSSVANLEGIASTWSSFNGTDQKAQNVQLAKNANQFLGSLNIITSNNSCFYDIRSRGALPVMSDVIMSISQLGLLIPNASGVMAATGGYLAGSGLKIINQLVKKKFNWNRPEERRAFLQLNCAFFDYRRMMEEMGIFNPETKEFKDQLIYQLKKERLSLIKLQKQKDIASIKIQDELDTEINAIEIFNQAGINPILERKLDEVALLLANRPVDHASKWKQLSLLANNIQLIIEMLKKVKLENRQEQNSVEILLSNFEMIQPDLARDGRSWNSSIDEFELRYRGPITAFMSQVSTALKNQSIFLEAVATSQDKNLAAKLTEYRVSLRESRAMSWGATQRLISLDAKIASLENANSNFLFSQDDEGKSDAVEILDHYRKLQKSIIGREGKGYLKNSLSSMDDVLSGLNFQVTQFDEAQTKQEKCVAAEKLRFAWAQYRFKAQESFDFVLTNQDLSNSSYKIGRERQKRSTTFVLNQIESVDDVNRGETPYLGSVGYYMNSVRNLMDGIEGRLQKSGCFLNNNIFNLKGD